MASPESAVGRTLPPMPKVEIPARTKQYDGTITTEGLAFPNMEGDILPTSGAASEIIRTIATTAQMQEKSYTYAVTEGPRGIQSNFRQTGEHPLRPGEVITLKGLS